MKIKMLLRIAVICICAISTIMDYVQAGQSVFKVSPGEGNEVKFISKATVESFEGRTNHIEGSMKLDPTDMTGGVDATFVVQMNTLDTGNKIRNGHMLDNHLHPEKFPISSFTLKSIDDLPDMKLIDGKWVKFKINGSYLLHGVTRDVTCETEAMWNSGHNRIDVVTKFSVVLSDYEIPRPGFLMLKVAEEQKIEIKFSAVAD